jgi:uncharacterized membrane protein HdeD (DUF308 family)
MRKGAIAVDAQSSLAAPKPGVSPPESLREIWVFLMGMGIALMILGVAAIGSSFIATFATVLVFGILMLLGAIFQVVTAIWGRSWRGFFLHLLAGVLYLIAGLFMIENPLEAALNLTFLIAVCLLIGGVLRIGLSVVERFAGWGWVLLNGVISVVLGVGIWRQWPLSGLWAIGLFVGIEMLFSGLSWVMLGLALRAAPKVVLPRRSPPTRPLSGLPGTR